MFAEKIGRYIFTRIRIPIFLLLLAIGPICVGCFLFWEKQSVELLQEQFMTAKSNARTAFDRKGRKERFLGRHAKSDPYFLDSTIESIGFLEDEKWQLKAWESHPAVSNKQLIAQRNRSLGENRLAFVEEDIQVSKLYKETAEKQKTPIELDSHDLQNLLAIIEDQTEAKIPRPQLVITNFSLKKKTTLLQNEILEINMDLLKREFL